MSRAGSRDVWLGANPLTRALWTLGFTCSGRWTSPQGIWRTRLRWCPDYILQGFCWWHLSGDGTPLPLPSPPLPSSATTWESLSSSTAGHELLGDSALSPESHPSVQSQGHREPWGGDQLMSPLWTVLPQRASRERISRIKHHSTQDQRARAAWVPAPPSARTLQLGTSRGRVFTPRKAASAPEGPNCRWSHARPALGWDLTPPRARASHWERTPWDSDLHTHV